MIKSRKGVVGRILTSIPALIFIFFIMLIFVLISVFIISLNGKDEGGSDGDERSMEKLDSKVLMELFLASEADGVRIENMLKEMYKGEGDLELMNKVQNKFHEVFSCGAKNKLIVLYYRGEGIYWYIQKYINYPDTLNNLKIPEKIEAHGLAYSEICDNNKNPKFGYAKELAKGSDEAAGFGFSYCVYVEEVARCY